MTTNCNVVSIFMPTRLPLTLTRGLERTIVSIRTMVADWLFSRKNLPKTWISTYPFYRLYDSLPGNRRLSDFLYVLTILFCSSNTDPPRQAVTEMLERSGYKNITVLYKQIRMIMFDSKIFHLSDIDKWRPGYKNRRINLTLLFGRSNSSCNR